jgi:hypothetical protein
MTINTAAVNPTKFEQLKAAWTEKVPLAYKPKASGVPLSRGVPGSFELYETLG